MLEGASSADLRGIDGGVFMPGHSIRKDYLGFQIIAVGEVCEILDDRGGRFNRFARQYLRMGIPADLVLALLVDEAEECIDAIQAASACSSRLTERRQWRDIFPA